MFGFDSYLPNMWVDGVATVHVKDSARPSKVKKQIRFRRGTWVGKGVPLSITILLGCAFVSSMIALDSRFTESKWKAISQHQELLGNTPALNLYKAVSSIPSEAASALSLAHDNLVAQLSGSLNLLREKIRKGDRSAIKESLVPLATEVSSNAEKLVSIPSIDEWASDLITSQHQHS